ncbi:MAG TPA: alpha/beta hydrolase-fold protein [Terrimicrobiaceae bacterium]|nr:alpha/beta hydrolase-fold protein [Terrimicrobiaceae bacterium]
MKIPRQMAMGAWALVLCGVAVAAADELKIHSVESPYQPGSQEIRVLLPDNDDPSRKFPVVYVLAVGQGRGSALRIFREADLHNRYGVILAESSFADTPWYGDHPSDPLIRQESYVRDFLVPFVEKNYSTLQSPDGRLLFGFSKSGWGALSLIFRNPDFFGYAASWDAPYFFRDFHYGMDKVFGTLEHLDRYRPDLLAVQARSHFQSRNRLVIGGEDKWGFLIPTPSGGSHTVEMHALLLKEGIPHTYRDDLKTKHTWSADWVVPMFEELMRISRASEGH